MRESEPAPDEGSRLRRGPGKASGAWCGGSDLGGDSAEDGLRTPLTVLHGAGMSAGHVVAQCLHRLAMAFEVSLDLIKPLDGLSRRDHG